VSATLRWSGHRRALLIICDQRTTVIRQLSVGSN
jgi:hypothetical protein